MATGGPEFDPEQLLRATLTKVLADVSPEDRYAICTGNGARLLNLDLDALAQTPAAHQAWSFADA